MHPLRMYPAGDAAIVIEWPARVDAGINDEAVAVAAAITTVMRERIKDAVVGYHTVTVYFDPLHVDAPTLESDIMGVAGEAPGRVTRETELLEIPVCYGGELGPDLDDVARQAGCGADEVVSLHTAREYRVFVVGFVPGFAYMGPVDERLTLPRRAMPRTRVPAGSVAIAAGQTGIYPMETPGGWHILGRTPVRPFDPARAQPVLLQAGDRVRFHPITLDEYSRTAAW